MFCGVKCWINTFSWGFRGSFFLGVWSLYSEAMWTTCFLESFWNWTLIHQHLLSPFEREFVLQSLSYENICGHICRINIRYTGRAKSFKVGIHWSTYWQESNIIEDDVYVHLCRKVGTQWWSSKYWLKLFLIVEIS